MKINRFVSRVVDIIPGLCQEARHPSEWPYKQDWIVERLKLDTRGGCYWVSGVNLNSKPGEYGRTFHWCLWACDRDNRPLSWRYDFTNAKYEIGEHERN